MIPFSSRQSKCQRGTNNAYCSQIRQSVIRTTDDEDRKEKREIMIIFDDPCRFGFFVFLLV